MAVFCRICLAVRFDINTGTTDTTSNQTTYRSVQEPGHIVWIPDTEYRYFPQNNSANIDSTGKRFDFSRLAHSATLGKQSDPSKDAVIYHIDRLQPENICTTDPKVSSKRYQKRGRQTTTTPRTYICEYCGRSFTKSYNLMIHTRTHTDERPFSCSLCNKRFKRQDHLRDHKFIHAKEKPFTCKICGKGFCQSRTLTIHHRTHGEAGQ